MSKLAVIVLVWVRLGGDTVADKALLVARLTARCTHGILVQAVSVARAVVGGADAAVVAREAAKVELGGVLLGHNGEGGKVLDLGVGGNDGVDFGVADGGLHAASQLTGGISGPVAMLGGAAALWQQDEDGLKRVRGHGGTQRRQTVDERIKGLWVLQKQ